MPQKPVVDWVGWSLEAGSKNVHPSKRARIHHLRANMPRRSGRATGCRKGAGDVEDEKSRGRTGFKNSRRGEKTRRLIATTAADDIAGQPVPFAEMTN